MKTHDRFELPPFAKFLPSDLVETIDKAGITLERDRPDPSWIQRFEDAIRELRHDVGGLIRLLDPEHEELFRSCADQLCSYSDKDAKPSLNRTLQSVREVIEQYRDKNVQERQTVISDLARPRVFFSKYPAANYAEAEQCKFLVAQYDETIKLLQSQIKNLEEGTTNALRALRADKVGRTRVNTWLRDCCGALYYALGKAGPSRVGVKLSEIAALVQAAYIASGREDEIDAITGENVNAWLKSLEDSPIMLSGDVARLYSATARARLGANAEPVNLSGWDQTQSRLTSEE
jgi:hypothetical protein